MTRKSNVAIAATICCALTVPLFAQTAQKPARPARPQKAGAAPAKPTEAPKPAPAPRVEDVRFKATYASEGMKTETVTFIKGQRERFEFADMVLLKQHDQKRTIQISRAANTYFVIPEGGVAPAAPAAAAEPPKPAGIVKILTTVVDTGERKTAFGRQARHVKTTIVREPAPGACDSTKQRIDTDGWYIDSPTAPASPSGMPTDAAPSGACADQVEATVNGDPKAIGFPIAYTTMVIGGDGKEVLASMEVSEYELTTLDAALFEVPAGLNAATDLQQLSKALSDANEVKLAAADAEAAAAPRPHTPGVVRIGVPEFTNKTSIDVDTRALRQRLISGLLDAKLEAAPMAAASQADLQKRASELGYDYVLLADVTELKVAKTGKLGGIMQAASSIGNGPGGSGPQDKTESAIAVKLIQPDGKQLVATTTKGKDGSGFSMHTGLGLARLAGGMYLSMMFGGPQMLARLNGMGAGNLGGVGLLGNPMLYQMQVGGLSGLGKGAGIDQTAGAASFLLQQAMAMNSSSNLAGVPGQGPSYDDSLGEALQNATKAVQKALQKK